MMINKSYDAIVIGAGVMGTSSAYYLSKKGLKVALVEAGDIADGTSSRCDGNIMVSDKAPGYDSTLTKMSQEMFESLTKELDDDFEWGCRGSLIVAENEHQFELAQNYCKDLQNSGISCRMLDAKEIHADEPYLAPDIVGGMETDSDSCVNPMLLCYALARGAKKLGADIYKHSPVTKILMDKRGEVAGIETSETTLAGKAVINCAGVWAPQIGSMVGIDIPIIPRQGQLLVAEKSIKVARRKIMEFGYMLTKFEDPEYKRSLSADMVEYGVALVYEPTGSDNFLLGSSRKFCGMDTHCDIRAIRAIAARGLRFFPKMKDIKVIRTYAGLRPYTPDHLPIISATKVPGFYVAAGHEGDGIALSLITGTIVANMITGNELPINIDPLSISRFEKKVQADRVGKTKN